MPLPFWRDFKLFGKLAYELGVAARGYIPGTRWWRRRITDYGRSEGWEVYLHDEKIAELVQPEYADMFWVSYHLTAVAPAYAALVGRWDFWDNPALRYRSKALPEDVSVSGVLVNPHPGGQVVVRGLYF